MKWKQTGISIFFIGLLGLGLVVYAVNLGTSVLTTSSTVLLTQNNYRWYSNLDALTPTASLSSENTATTTPSSGTVLRLRMNVKDTSAQLNAGATFTLQYGNSTSGSWTSLGTSTTWIFADNPGVADGQVIVSTVLSDSDLGESYGESNPSAATPNAIAPSEKGEWDWVVKNNSASTGSAWFFRMIYSSSTALDGYDSYPALSAAVAAATSSPPAPGPVVGVGGRGGGTGYGATSGPSGAAGPPIIYPSPCENLIVQMTDLNGDCRVDIVDLSVLLYYFEERGIEVSRYDFNRSDEVDFPDVSIMMYYWTG